MEKISNEKPIYKIVLLRDKCSSKTMFINKLTKKNLDDNNISTIANVIQILNIKINTQDKGEIDVEVHLQESAGNKKFLPITIGEIKGAEGIILMYDITNNDSFKSLESWVEIVKNEFGNRNNYLMILLGNKLDLVNKNSEKREVTKEEALSFCEKNDIFWGGEFDALMDNVDDIKNGFKLIVEEIYKKVENINCYKININKCKNMNIWEKSKKKKNCIK